jgi:hypothetical protein
MVQKIFLKIRNERWLHHDARYMQKHMDLHLINLLEDEKLNKALDNIRDPKTLYNDVLHRLIAEKVTNVGDEWEEFKTHLGQAIEKAAKVEIDIGKAQTFVDQLRKEFSEGYLKSEILGSSFRIDCSGEYENCDEEERKEFYNACSIKLNEVLEKELYIGNQEKFKKELSPKVVQYMIAMNDKAALPRCDACCRLCKSLCIEPANHDTQLRPHDAIHQPGGVAGYSYYSTKELVSSTCSQDFEQDQGFYIKGDCTLYKYRDYDKVFPEWKNPKLQEELPVREYILATYNEKIAQKYNLKPAKDIPASYYRDLSSIKEQLKREIGG